jgi:hypothetical protein
MRKFFAIGLLVFLSIVFAPILSNKFDAQAGRTVVGDGGEFCVASCPNVPCYDELTGQQLPMSTNPSTECSESRAMAQEPSKGDGNAGTIVLIAFATIYLFKRFMF